MADAKILIISQNSKDELVASTTFPESMKKKGIYFQKTKGNLTQEDMPKEVLYTDLAPQPIEQLHLLLDEIFLPMAENHSQVQPIPEAISHDVIQQFHKLSAQTNVTLGKTKVFSPLFSISFIYIHI